MGGLGDRPKGRPGAREIQDASSTALPKRALEHPTEGQAGLCRAGEEAEGPWAPGGSALWPSLRRLPATLPKPSC